MPPRILIISLKPFKWTRMLLVDPLVDCHHLHQPQYAGAGTMTNLVNRDIRNRSNVAIRKG